MMTIFSKIEREKSFSKSKFHMQNRNMLHYVTGNPINAPLNSKQTEIILGMGCFWGAEKVFWNQTGIFSTAVGYTNGTSKMPTYEEVCTGHTGHNEVVRLIYDENEISSQSILKRFWENHDPTQGMRQGNDAGTQYRSGIYCSSQKQLNLAEDTREQYQNCLLKSDGGNITTEIQIMSEFFFAEDYHQQYLAKNPDGYCGLGGTGIPFK